jgi:hypothetical protein
MWLTLRNSNHDVKEIKMGVAISKLSNNQIQVSIGAAILNEAEQKIIRPALTRHLIELSAAIESAAPHPEMAERRDAAILDRRRTFELIEKFDMVRGEINSVSRWLGVVNIYLERPEIELLRNALIWFRDNWAEPGKQLEATIRVVTLLEKA